MNSKLCIISYDLQILYTMYNPRSRIKELLNIANNANSCFPLILISLLKYNFMSHFFRIINIQKKILTYFKLAKEKFSQLLIAETDNMSL